MITAQLNHNETVLLKSFSELGETCDFAPETEVLINSKNIVMKAQEIERPVKVEPDKEKSRLFHITDRKVIMFSQEVIQESK